MKRTGSTGIIASFLILFSACQKEDVTPKEPTGDLPQIVINEFMASNSSSYQDSDTGEYDDWIEIYNSGDEAVNLGGLYISDNKQYKSKYKIPTTNAAKTTIQPGGYLILWADSEMEQGELHVDFKLSAEGEDLGIFTADGLTIDETTFGPQVTDKSTGRLSNNYNNWTTFSNSTPGSANK